MAQIQKITPCLWFDRNAEEAVNHYVSIFQNSRIVTMSRYGEAGAAAEGNGARHHLRARGTALHGVERRTAFQVHRSHLAEWCACDTQDEIDAFWEKLSAGGEKGRCGWLKDKFGLSWQVVPSDAGRDDEDRRRRARTASWPR